MKKHLLFYVIVLLLLILLVAGCGDQSGTVKGTVTRADTGEPVASAMIYVYMLEQFDEVTHMDTYQKGSVLHRTETDETGVYSFTVKANPYVIEAQMPGMKKDSTLTKVKRGKTITHDFSLSPLP